MSVSVQSMAQPVILPPPRAAAAPRGAAGAWRRQFAELRDGGLSVLLRKLRTLVDTILAVPAVLLMRLVRPLLTIRVGPLSSSRIGPFSAHVELYLCERDAGLHGQRTLDLFFHARPVCNRQLQAMWERTLPVSRFAAALARVNRWFPGADAHRIPMQPNGERDIRGLFATGTQHLAFTAEERRRGWAFLHERGIHEGTPYICFLAREALYLAATYPDRNWDYHNYRNTDVRSLLPAVEALTRLGYAVLRMGVVVRAPLDTANPRIIDYASHGRTEFLDIFLSAHCRFYLGDPSGIVGIPMTFRRPIAFVNYIPFEYVHSWDPRHLFIPKKLWLRAERRLLTFRDILESGVGRLHWTEEYERRGIEVIENTPEEIAALAIEMDERLQGTWQAAAEDEELQRRFWSLFASSGLHGVIRSRIGAAFLREHRALLEP